MDAGLGTILLFGSMIFVLAMGVPIAIALGGISVGFIYFAWNPNALAILPMKGFAVTSSFELTSVPLFIFMAAMLQRSQIAEELFESISRFFGGVKGGLAVGTIFVCTIFAAMAGISGAATISMGLIALPAMLSRHYHKNIALGSVAAGGSLGILIPPSVTMIIYGVISSTSIGKLYAGGILPGLMLAAFFSLYILTRSALQPSLVGVPERTYSLAEKFFSLKGLVVPGVLVVCVLGSILTGLASVSESAAVGALGSVIATALRGRLSWPLVREACEETLRYSCLSFWIIIGAAALSTFYTSIGAARLIEGFVLDLDLNRYLVLLTIMLILILLGMVLDTIGIIMITVPVFVPIIISLGFDPVWFGILFIIAMEIGFLTPPFGYNLFYLKGVAPSGVVVTDIYRSVMPFVVLMMIGLGVCMLFPEIILVLPNMLF